jgi:Aspartyl protease/PDZ domain
MPAAGRLGTALAILLAFAPGAPASAAAPSTVVPLRMTDTRPFVPVTINGTRFDFVVDTGGVDAISAQAAAELGLHVTPGAAVGGANAGTIAGGETVVDTFSVGSLTMRGAHFLVADFSALAAHIGFRRFDGIVGYEFLRAHAVTFDFRHGLLAIDGAAAHGDPAHAVSFRMLGNVPVVNASLDGVDAEFMVDTGDRSALTLFTPFARAHYADRAAMLRNVVTGFGLRAPIVADLARLRVLELAGYAVAAPLARLATQEQGGFASDAVAGSIGSAILRRFVVTFDFPRGVLTLRDPADVPRIEWDRSGTWISRDGGQLRVDDVVAGGPGAEAGLRVGDRISAVDGTPASAVGLPSLRARLASPDTASARFTVRRGTATLTVTVQLRTLV